MKTNWIQARELATLAVPVIGARLLYMTMGLADIVLVARLAPDELAFLSLGWAPTAVFLVAGMGLLHGISVMAARRAGEGLDHLTGRVWQRGIGHALACGLACLTILLAGADLIFDLLRLEPNLANGAAHVARVLALGLPFFLVHMACHDWLEAMKRPWPGVITLIVANVLNIALGFWLIPGGFGLPALGAEGAAWATTIVRLLMMLALLAVVWFAHDHVRNGVRARHQPDREEAREQVRLGLASGGSHVFEVSAFAGMNVFAGWVSLMAAGAYSVALNAMALAFMIPWGLGVAGAVLVSRAIGAQDLVARRGAMRLTLLATGLVMAPIVLAFVFGRSLIAHGYAGDAPDLFEAVQPLILLGGLAVMFDSYQVVLAQLLRARNDAWLPTISHFVSYGLVMIPLGYWLSIVQGRGAVGLMEAIITSSIVSACVLAVRLWWVERADVT